MSWGSGRRVRPPFFFGKGEMKEGRKERGKESSDPKGGARSGKNEEVEPFFFLLYNSPSPLLLAPHLLQQLSQGLQRSGKVRSPQAQPEPPSDPVWRRRGERGRRIISSSSSCT